MRTVKVREDEDGNPYILLEELIPNYPYKADSYTLEVIEDKGVKKLMLKFFDEDGNIIDISEETT